MGNCKTAKDGKKEVKFSIPEFAFERSLSDAENEQADAVLIFLKHT